MRFFVDVILAVLVSAVVVAVVLLVYGSAMQGPWENVAIADAADEGQWIWVNKEPIHYRTWGPDEGEPLVLVHGFEVGASALWADLGASLGRAGYRVVAVDLPPMGLSSRDAPQDLSLQGQAYALAATINELGLERTALVAQGWGSAIALQVALEQPQLVGSLVLVGPQLAPGISGPERFVARLSKTATPTAWLAHAGGPVWRLELRRQVAEISPAFRGYVQAARNASHIVGTSEALSAFYELEPDRLAPVEAISPAASCLIVRGDKDALFTAESADQLALALGAQLYTIENAGHLVSLDDPVTLRQVILGLLEP